MIETKPRINRGNRGQLFRATWLSSARCSETFRRTTERVECSTQYQPCFELLMFIFKLIRSFTDPA